MTEDKKHIMYEIIVYSVKKNHVLEPQAYDSLLASKHIEGNTQLPHMVILFLCNHYGIGLELPYIHLKLTDKKYLELEQRVSKLVHESNTKFLTKVKLCIKLCDHALQRLKNE